MSKETLGIVVVAIVAFVSLNEGFLTSVSRAGPCLQCENVTNITEECTGFTTQACKVCFLERNTYNNTYYYTLGCADKRQSSCLNKTRRSLEDIMAVSRYDRRNNMAESSPPDSTTEKTMAVTTGAMKTPTAPTKAAGSYNTTTNNYTTSTTFTISATTTVASANTTTAVVPTTTVAPANTTTTVASANTTARPAATTTKKPEPVKEESCCQICTNTLDDFVCNNDLFKCQPGACYDEIGSHGCQVIVNKDYCSNKTNAKKTCKLSCQLCDLVDGNWAAWQEWGDCSVSCNNGTRFRMRNCTDPAPENDGEECHGNSTETEDCSGGDRCPADGEWGTWNSWTGCSKTCGVGMRHRDRNCNDPYPEADGLFCLGEAREYEVCYNKSCEDGHWDAWSDWGTCSTTCGFGYIDRARNCSVPSLFGHACSGESKQTIMCVIDCNDGLWDDWSSWSTCSHTCGVGQKSRDRNCNSTGILGRSCLGKDSETVLCHSEACEKEISAFAVKGIAKEGPRNGSIALTIVLTNDGEDYDKETGIFNCSIPGLYSFFVSIEKQLGVNQAYCTLMVDTEPKIHIASRSAFDNSQSYQQASNSVVLDLKAGDEVYLGRCSDPMTMTQETTFSGVLMVAHD